MIPSNREADLLRQLQGTSEAVRRAAASELFELTYPALFQVALRMTGSPELADEAVQETFVRVLRSIREFRGGAKLSTWVFRIGLREALRAKGRVGQKFVELPNNLRSDHSDPGQTCANAEAAARILDAIAGLPESQRAVVSLAAIEELPQTEIARILGIPVGTVYSRLSTAREQLRAKL